jgi:hypothetical protein
MKATVLARVEITDIDTNAKGLDMDELALPSSPCCMVARAEGAGVRYNLDGTPPTPAQGLVLDAGSAMVYEGPLGRVKFIAAEVGRGARLMVTFYRSGWFNRQGIAGDVIRTPLPTNR